MSYSESLTVRILGDSSGLQRELDSVMQSLSTLQRDIESASRAGARIGDALSRVSRATGPLRQVSSLLTGVSQQARALSAQAISLNLAPAIAALQRLNQRERVMLLAIICACARCTSSRPRPPESTETARWGRLPRI